MPYDKSSLTASARLCSAEATDNPGWCGLDEALGPVSLAEADTAGRRGLTGLDRIRTDRGINAMGVTRRHYGHEAGVVRSEPTDAVYN